MIRVTNIQRMSFDDGPGIRTTVFLKGCSIHCPWCANPENLIYDKQTYFLEDECIEGVYGEDYSPNKLLKILLKDYKYWGDGGGVTFSGGEALLQEKELEPLFVELKNLNISIGIETALFVPAYMLKAAANYIDFYYVDVKILDGDACKKILGGDVSVFMENINWLIKQTDKIVFRVPCSKEYVLKEENRKLLWDFFKSHNQFPVEIFALHHLGEKKYRALNISPPKIKSVSEEQLTEFKNELVKYGCRANVIQI